MSQIEIIFYLIHARISIDNYIMYIHILSFWFFLISFFLYMSLYVNIKARDQISMSLLSTERFVLIVE